MKRDPIWDADLQPAETTVSPIARVFRHLPRVEGGCVRHLLHESPAGRVELCTGGTASLVVGALTLRLPIGALVGLHDLLHDALHQLAEAERASREPAPRPEEN